MGDDMCNIAVVGTSYVGLLTSIGLAHLGHYVICIDDQGNRVNQLRNGHLPYDNQELYKRMEEAVSSGRLTFITNYAWGVRNVDIIFIAVEPVKEMETATGNAPFQHVLTQVASHIKQDVTIINRSSFPIGSYEGMKQIVHNHISSQYKVDFVYNPALIEGGGAVSSIAHGDHVIVGCEKKETLFVMESLYRRLKRPLLHTNVASAEMIQYIWDTFYNRKSTSMTKITTMCTELHANVKDVEAAMASLHPPVYLPYYM
ncbi:hypothetical protein ACFFGV_11955 [Pontibacillus salicampi]|uniref:UDP-glucose/GDP-mannose dehydrogenase N-terminal domain-containing protein n=1 Tax=Pontibacillus salicampi TaxID=1449801 RepID=A0ABV6LPG2_9BACI